MLKNTESASRALIYVRQSVAREDSISLELQEKACRDHARTRGYTVVDVIADPGVSGLQFSRRPGIQRVLKAVEAGEAETVLVWRWSRLSRRRQDQVVIMTRIEDVGGRVESATEPVDATTAGGRFSREILFAMAVFESEQKSEQWKEAQARRRANGLPHGGDPRFGYIRNKGRFEPDPVTGPLLREAYLSFNRGAGSQRLAKMLNDAGARTVRGREWSACTLLRSLDNGFAAGLLREASTGTFLPGSHEPLITPEEWQTYQRVRAGRRQVGPRARNAVYMLSQIVVCGLCGSRMYASPRRGEKGHYLRCSRYVQRRTCKGVHITRALAEARVGLWLGGHVAELASRATASVHRSEEHAKAQQTADEHRTEVQRLDAALVSLATNLAEGLVDPATYSTARAGLLDRRDAAHRDLEAAEAELARLAPLPDDANDRLVTATADMDTAEWSALVRQVVRSVEVHPQTITITPVVGDEVTVAR